MVSNVKGPFTIQKVQSFSLCVKILNLNFGGKKLQTDTIAKPSKYGQQI
jgi:hypothetical protein